jgi:hypothetical protein
VGVMSGRIALAGVGRRTQLGKTRRRPVADSMEGYDTQAALASPLPHLPRDIMAFVFSDLEVRSCTRKVAP